MAANWGDGVTAEQLATDKGNAIHRGSEDLVGPEIVPKYQHDNDLETAIETKIPEKRRLSEEFPQKIDATEEIPSDEEYQPGFITGYWRKYRPFGHAIIWLLVTA